MPEDKRVMFNIRKKVKEVEKRGHRNKKKEAEVFGYLDSQLKSKEKEGRVVAIITYGGDGKIHCYCYDVHISGSVIFETLNLSIGIKGTSLSGLITYPAYMPSKVPYKKGYLAPGKYFGLSSKEWVCLINIECDSDSDAISFH